jgi:hypothetical protein
MATDTKPATKVAKPSDNDGWPIFEVWKEYEKSAPLIFKFFCAAVPRAPLPFRYSGVRRFKLDWHVKSRTGGRVNGLVFTDGCLHLRIAGCR